MVGVEVKASVRKTAIPVVKYLDRRQERELAP
jgi:hypothetical protein